MTPTEAAILRTLAYADVFQFPMTLAELHRYLIAHQAITLDNLRQTLQCSSLIQRHIIQDSGYIAFRENVHHIQIRQQREQWTQAVWKKALRYGRWLSRLPFVRMVALTGALAVRNPSGLQDDFDYILVTQPGRVWLARGFAVLLVKFVRLLGDEICPNYVLASDKLHQQRRNLYTAHELLQMVPLYGEELYQRMLQENAWFQTYLPNAEPQRSIYNRRNLLKSALEMLFGGRLGRWLEQWEYQRKMRKFEQQQEEASSAAELDSGRVKGHFQDKGHPVMIAYHARLERLGVQRIELPLAGD